MNVLLRPALWSSLVLALSFTQCVMEPPMLPPGANTGYSLDSGPSLRRNRQDTRYLETTQPPPLPNPANPNFAGPPTGIYETPPDIDPSIPQAPETPPSPDTAAITPPAPVSPPTTPPAPETPPAPAVKPTTPEQLPFGLPVPSKKGFVYSPFDKSQMVDVRGIPPGKKVRCPYTSKIFLVP